MDSSLRPFVSHVKSKQKKAQRELEKQERPETAPAAKVKAEPNAGRRAK